VGVDVLGRVCVIWKRQGLYLPSNHTHHGERGPTEGVGKRLDGAQVAARGGTLPRCVAHGGGKLCQADDCTKVSSLRSFPKWAAGPATAFHRCGAPPLSNRLGVCGRCLRYGTPSALLHACGWSSSTLTPALGLEQVSH
jgi:hypothetical protein